ncbi:MAG: GNAT family N-acetyltransferase [Candidatus Riflebacteria bacterium]|nr:GNAT family N-acetyltransferase [Candidatus Riflebacteria bacterium]
MITLQLQETDSLPDDLTDDLSPPSMAGMKRFFLKAFLEGRLPGIRTSLLVARGEDGRFLAASAFSRMRLEMDCIAPPTLQAMARTGRRLSPGFLVLDLATFGLPASMADQETVFAPSLGSEELVRAREALVGHSLQIFRTEGLSACLWKEFDEAGWAAWASALVPAGFHRFPSVPVSLQEVTWSSPADYLSRLRSGYRRQMTANLARACSAGLSVETDLDFWPFADEFHTFYLQVLAHSKTRLETLTPEFFHGLAAEPRIRYIRATLGGRPAGGALCYVHAPEVLVFLYVGMDYAVLREVDLYFNLLKAIADLAAAKGVRAIRWGQTSPDAKGRLGARLQPLWFAIRLRNPLVRAALPWLGPLLFPERGQLERRVFADRPAE